MKKFILTFLTIIFAFTSNVEACDLAQFKFGSSIQEAAKKYKFEDDILSERYFEMPIRASAICTKETKGQAVLVFFENKLAKVSLIKVGSKISLIDNVEGNFGNLTIQPNFKKIGNKQFASNVDNKELYISYSYINKNGTIQERVVISDKKLAENISDSEAKNENKDARRGVERI